MSRPVPTETLAAGPRRPRRRSVLKLLERNPRRTTKKQLGGSLTVSILVHVGILVALGLATHLVGLPHPLILISSGFDGPDESSLHSPEMLLSDDISETLANPTDSQVSMLPGVASPDPYEMLSRSRRSGSLSSGGGGGGRQGTDKGGFFGVPLEEDSVVFVLDRSGSMRGGRLQRVQYELQSAVNGLAAKQKFNVLLYNTGVDHALPSSRTSLVPASPANCRKAVAAAMACSASGGTNGSGAIQEALKLRPEAIVFLTDGEFDIDVDVDVFEQNTSGTIIHTVSIGDGTSLEVLRRIAGGTGGRFQHVFVKKQSGAAANQVQQNRDAQRLLKMATGLENRKKLAKAAEYCERIIQQYPNRKSAETARIMLKRITKQQNEELLRQLGATKKDLNSLGD